MHTNEKRKFLVDMAYAAAWMGILYFAYRFLLSWFLPFVAGYLIASVVRPGVRWCANRSRLNEKQAGYLVLLAVYFMLGFAVFWCGAAVLRILLEQAAQFPDWYKQTLQPFLGQAFEWLQKKLPAALSDSWSAEALLAGTQAKIFDFSTWLITWLGTMTGRLPDLLMTFLFTILCSLLISSNYDAISEFLGKQVPGKYHSLASMVKRGTGEAVLSYIQACLLMLLCTFLQLLLGLWLLQVEQFLLIAAIITLLDLIPAVGISMVFLPWALVCFLQGERVLALGLLLLMGIVITVHGALEPKLVGARLGMNPLVSICAVYFGYRTFGVGGMMVFPIVVQLVMGLQKAGIIKLWK